MRLKQEVAKLQAEIEVKDRAIERYNITKGKAKVPEEYQKRKKRRKEKEKGERVKG